jgi:hypothetical protein
MMDAVVSGKGSATEVSEKNLILNCIRILTRFLPFVFEKSTGPEDRQLEHGIFWEAEKDTGLIYGEKLCDIIKSIAFLPGFSVPLSNRSNKLSEDYPIWKPGIGNKEMRGESSPDLYSNRIELLRLILVLLSPQLYDDAGKLFAEYLSFGIIVYALMSKV